MKTIVRMVTALAIAAAFVLSVSADDVKVGKGKAIVAVPGESVLMTCPHCKTDYVVKLTKSSKPSCCQRNPSPQSASTKSVFSPASFPSAIFDFNSSAYSSIRALAANHACQISPPSHYWEMATCTLACQATITALPRRSGLSPLLDRSVERIHVDMQDFAHNYLVKILIPGQAAT